MATQNDISLTNQYGEKSINKINSVTVAIANATPAKTGITAIVAIATTDLVAVSTPDATDEASAVTLVNAIKAAYNLNVVLANANKAKINAVLAAMKVVS